MSKKPNIELLTDWGPEQDLEFFNSMFEEIKCLDDLKHKTKMTDR